MTADDKSSDRLDRLSRAISTRTMTGWNIVDRNDTDLSAVLIFPEKPVKHIIHLIITLCTCGIWGPVWAVLALLHKGDRRVRISIDAAGNLLEEEMQL